MFWRKPKVYSCCRCALTKNSLPITTRERPLLLTISGQAALTNIRDESYCSRMKYLPHIAAVILGLIFLIASTLYLSGLSPYPEFPEGTPINLFMGAFVPTGYMGFIKLCELAGGLLILVPRTRNLGLLVLGPIVVNIVAFHIFITRGAGLLGPMLIASVVCSLYLLWDARRKFLALI